MKEAPLKFGFLGNHVHSFGRHHAEKKRIKLVSVCFLF
jgi:hypothetical protein